MCAQFLIKTSQAQLLEILKADFGADFPQSVDTKVLPHAQAPVAVFRNGTLRWDFYRFSLLPAWSKESKVKFATHNARIETVTEKPTWRGPFLKKHCVIPLSAFIEPIYVGNWAGSMVAFAAEGDQLMWAAGIYDEWTNPETGEIIDSFSILTKEPPPQIADIGHDRCPIFIEKAYIEPWLKIIGKPEEMKRELLSHTEEILFFPREDRKLKPGWEKRHR